MKHLSYFFCLGWLAAWLVACDDKSSFITDASYRSLVEQDFRKKQVLMPQGDLFAILTPRSPIMSGEPCSSCMLTCLWRILPIIPVISI